MAAGFKEKFISEWKTFFVFGGPKKEVSLWHLAFSLIIVGLILLAGIFIFVI